MGWESIIFNHIDMVWVPVALLALHRGQKLWGALFVAACAFVMRLQIELMQSIGYGRGFFHLMEAPLYIRGLITYAAFIAFFLILAYFSPKSDKFVLIAAAITIFVVAFCVSSVVMVL